LRNGECHGGGRGSLRDDDIYYWYIDPDITNVAEGDKTRDVEPLLVNLIDTWKLRPAAVTLIPNFFLASDYVRTNTDLATMEAANEAARRAVNGILEATRVALSVLQIVDDLSGAAAPGLAPGVHDPNATLDPARLMMLAQEINGTRVRAPNSAAGNDAGDKTKAPDGAESLSAMAFEKTKPFLTQLASYRAQTLEAMVALYRPERVNPISCGIIRETLNNAGKGLRPALCLATCGAFGGRVTDALHSAAALEMLHNAFLVHDDVEDASENRHSRPTVHITHGVPLAVNAGDAMQALSMRLLRKNAELTSPDIGRRVCEEFDHMLMRSLEG
jgi:hypothetical protein